MAEFDAAAVNDYLLLYVDSYERFVSSTNAVSALLFGAVVYLSRRSLGFTGDGNDGKPILTWSLCACMALCVATFVSNFLIQGTIADFFSVMYRQEVVDECELQTASRYFDECVRDGRLKILGRISLASCLLAFVLMLAWLVGEIRNGRGMRDKGDAS